MSEVDSSFLATPTPWFLVPGGKCDQRRRQQDQAALCLTAPDFTESQNKLGGMLGALVFVLIVAVPIFMKTIPAQNLAQKKQTHGPK